MKILIIEDENDLLQTLKNYLEKENYRVETATNFGEALDKIISFEYDCILLDVMLPDGNGLDILREIKKQNKNEAIIITSAKDSVDDKIEGLDIGADDYVAKPFHFAELNARIKSSVRRKNQNGEQFMHFRNAKVSPENRLVWIDEIELTLNRKEFDLFYYFITNPQRLITKTAIAEYVWGDHAEQADNLDFVYSQIKNLRKKLTDAKAEFEIQAVYGVGYKLI